MRILSPHWCFCWTENSSYCFYYKGWGKMFRYLPLLTVLQTILVLSWCKWCMHGWDISSAKLQISISFFKWCLNSKCIIRCVLTCCGLTSVLYYTTRNEWKQSSYIWTQKWEIIWFSFWSTNSFTHPSLVQIYQMPICFFCSILFYFSSILT